jgi:hypothetical protein
LLDSLLDFLDLAHDNASCSRASGTRLGGTFSPKSR